MKCVFCNHEIEDDAQFCPNCGKKLPQPKCCPHCGEQLDDDAQFCPNCGKKTSQSRVQTNDLLTQHPNRILLCLGRRSHRNCSGG